MCWRPIAKRIYPSLNEDTKKDKCNFKRMYNCSIFVTRSSTPQSLQSVDVSATAAKLSQKLFS